MIPEEKETINQFVKNTSKEWPYKILLTRVHDTEWRKSLCWLQKNYGPADVKTWHIYYTKESTILTFANVDIFTQYHLSVG